jgi:hypothetical protein
MGKRIFKLSFVAVFCFNLIIGWAMTVHAQSPQVTPTATSMAPVAPASPTLAAVPVSSDPNIVTFAQLRRNEIQMVGPYDSASFSFFMPASWQLKSGAELHVLVGVSFTAVVQNQSNLPVASGGGMLTATLNGNSLGVLPLDQVGEVEWKLSIPPSAFATASNSGNMVLRFVLNSGISCTINEHTSIFIHPTSYLILPHDIVQPDTSLVKFPRPIYQGSFIADSALLIVPEHPSAAELQAALTVAAGLGNLSNNRLLLDMTTIGRFRPDQPGNTQAITNHLIFVGKPSSLSVLSQLSLPNPVVSGQFQSSGGGQDDGYVQMVSSPWSSSHVALIVSGNTDAAITKAAQAVSTGVLRANKYPNLAVVQQVQASSVAAPQAVDQTVADLGYQEEYFQGRGTNETSYIFNIPPGRTVAPDAYFELVYGHSVLLNYDRSAIVVWLNGRPIGSVRMSDETASHPANRIRFTLPASAVQPGRNELLIDTNSVPIDDCTPPGIQVLWINLWPQSTFHLPLDVASVSTITNQDLASYPAPFAYDPLLSNTAFVLAHDDLVSWHGATEIAEFLGYQARGSITELSVFYGDDFPAAQRAKYYLIIIGRPSQIPVVGELSKSLPAPFSSGTDNAAESNFQVTYRIPPDSPLGYVEMAVSPWNPDRIVLAILGNDSQGVDWAANALINPTLSSRLAGNFAVVNASQVITTDTRAASVAENGSNPISLIPAPIPAGQNTTETPVSRPLWVLPVLLVTILLMAFILVRIVLRNLARRNHRNPPPNG